MGAGAFCETNGSPHWNPPVIRRLDRPRVHVLKGTFSDRVGVQPDMGTFNRGVRPVEFPLVNSHSWISKIRYRGPGSALHLA
jgi:hypothetical protein